MQEQLLSQIPDNSVVEILSIDSSMMRVKLMEMGLIEGSEIKTLYRAPLGCPMAIEISGSVLSLRLDEAQQIHVKKTEQ